MLSPRARKIFPLRPPSILIIRPPGIKGSSKKLAKLICESFDLMNVNIAQSLQREIDQKSEIGKFSFEKISKNDPSFILKERNLT